MPVDPGGMHHAIGPVAAVAVVLLLVLFTRWAFGAPKARAASSAEDGLLTPVATLGRRESALQLRALLSDAGIRSTVRVVAAHRAEVLVFPEDARRARELASSFAPPGRDGGQSYR